MIRVIIFHKNPLFRVGIRSVLRCHSEICIVGEPVEQEHLLELTATTQPDVVLFDGTHLNAVEVVAQVRQASGHGIMVFVPAPHEESLFRLMMSGAAAYELSTISGDDLVEKIRRVANGEYLISGEILRPVVKKQQQPKKQRQDPSQVSDREIIILRYAMQGLSNKQIGRILHISSQTVKNHISSINSKLHVRDRTAAVVTALRRDLISFQDPQAPQDKEVIARRVDLDIPAAV